MGKPRRGPRFRPSCFFVMALAMKAAPMKSMKAMKKVKKVSIIARGKRAKAAVFNGKKEKTVGGLTKATLTKSKSGKVVSKAASARAKKNFAGSMLEKWMKAVKLARNALNITGFCAVGGKTAQGKALYAKAKSLLDK